MDWEAMALETTDDEDLARSAEVERLRFAAEHALQKLVYLRDHDDMDATVRQALIDDEVQLLKKHLINVH